MSTLTDERLLETYDAGHLNDFGGGNVGWWQDYIRAELERAHEFYAEQLEAMQEGMLLLPIRHIEWMLNPNNGMIGRLPFGLEAEMRAILSVKRSQEKLVVTP